MGWTSMDIKNQITSLHDIANRLLNIQPKDIADLWCFTDDVKQAETINRIAKVFKQESWADQQLCDIACNLDKEGLAFLRRFVEYGTHWEEKGEIL